MSIILPVLVIVFSILAIALLQLTPGTFSIFYHYNLGKHGKKGADALSLSFILGVELFVCFMWFIVYSLLLIVFYNLPDLCPNIILWLLSGICFAEAIITAFFYFRHSHKPNQSTALFLPRHIANTILAKTRNAKSRSDAIILGFFTGLPELIFTLPLYIISAIILLNSTSLPRALIMVLFVIASTAPLFAIYFYYHSGHNLADLTRFRTKIKPLIRIGLSLTYIFLSLTIIGLGAVAHE